MTNFKFEGRYGTYYNCNFEVGRYSNGNIGITIFSNDVGPVTTVTVNPGYTINDDCIAIKNYSENTGMVDWLISKDLIESNPVMITRSGFVEIPVHKLTEKGMSEFIAREETEA